jgi:hypothetical protein
MRWPWGFTTTPAGDATGRNTKGFDSYFSLSSLDWQRGFKGSYQPGSASNAYHMFDVNGKSGVGIRPAR